jgi:hypothetical protein
MLSSRCPYIWDSNDEFSQLGCESEGKLEVHCQFVKKEMPSKSFIESYCILSPTASIEDGRGARRLLN